MSGSTTSPAPAGEEVEEEKQQYEDFLDDPYNMAMYVVLPIMILVYGGCCFIYCMAKLHRYCRRRARRRDKQHLIPHNNDSNDDDNNTLNTLNLPRLPSAQSNRLTPSLFVVDYSNGRRDVGVQASPTRAPRPPKPPTPRPSSSLGVRPAYVRSQDLQHHMRHLDDQLKAAFHMISDEPKGKSYPDVHVKPGENKRPVKGRLLTRPMKRSWIQFYASDQ